MDKLSLATIIGVLILTSSSTYSGGASLHEPVFHQGMCDASAAVALNEDLIVVGDDEDNALRVYSRHHGGPPLLAVDVSVFLGLRRGAEVDIEASTRLGDRIYWLSSHGTNVKGKKRLSRQRFFATTGAVHPSGIDLRPIGRPYVNLLQDLLREPRLAQFGLAAAANRPPKTPGALSIEGLTATPQGHLLIGFRNPIPGGRALLVPLLNPGDLIDGGRARFGNPMLLDLGGLGIRSIELVQDRYVILAGTRDGRGDSWLYEWDGISPKPRRVDEIVFGSINPEAVTLCSQEGDTFELLVVSDDGTVKMGATECKRLKDPNQKQFKSVTVRVRLRPEMANARVAPYSRGYSR
jgi:hypothetical protein